MRESIGDGYIEADFSGLENLLGELDKNHFVDVGILGDNAQKTDAGGATLGYIGAVQEFGTIDGRIPKRSFIVMPIQTRQAQIQADVEPRMAKHLQSGDVNGVFVDIGVSAEAQIQDAFDTRGFGIWKPNAQSTIDQKGSDSPLIDIGTLRKSVSSEAGPA